MLALQLCVPASGSSATAYTGVPRTGARKDGGVLHCRHEVTKLVSHIDGFIKLLPALGSRQKETGNPGP